MLKKSIFFIVMFFIAMFLVAQPQQADIVILLDNSGTMLPFYDQINTRVLTEIASKFVRLGDTIHLISFSEKAVPEMTQQVKTETDVQKIVSRFNLLYPIGAYTDFLSAVQYSQQFISSLDIYTEKILIIISDGIYHPSPSNPNYNVPVSQIDTSIKTILTKMKSEGIHLYYIKAPFPENSIVSDFSGNIISTPQNDNVLQDLNDVAQKSSSKNSQNSKTTTSDSKANSDSTNNSSSIDNTKTRNDEPNNETTASVTDSTSSYYDYSTSIKESNTALTSTIENNIPDDNLLNNILALPIISGKNDLGNKSFNFNYPLTVENTSNETIKLELDSVFVDGVDILKQNIFITISPNDTATAKVPFDIPSSFSDGNQIITAFFLFADNVRTQPQELSFSVSLNRNSNFFSSYGIILLIIVLIILAIALIIFGVQIATKKNTTSENQAQNESLNDELNNTKIQSTGSMPFLAEGTAKGSGSMPSLAGSTAKASGSMPSLAGSSAKASGSMPSLAGSSAKSSGSMPSLAGSSAKSSGSMPSLAGSSAKSSGSMPSLAGASVKASGSMPKLPTQQEISARKNKLEAANPNEEIKAISDKSITLDFVVDGQSRNIGFRNIHSVTPGSRKSIGGGFSTFSIFLVQVPASIAEIRYDGNVCNLALLKTEYFPYETENVIKDCIGKTITVKADTGFEMTIHFELYKSQTERLNELLLSIVPEEDKKRYIAK